MSSLGTVKLAESRLGRSRVGRVNGRDEDASRPNVRQAYIDGELCGVFLDGITSFAMIQAESDAGNAAGLVYFIFDLLHLDGDEVGALPLIERKARLAALLSGGAPPLPYSDYRRGQGAAFRERACKLELEGIVSKRADAAYAPRQPRAVAQGKP